MKVFDSPYVVLISTYQSESATWRVVGASVVHLPFTLALEVGHPHAYPFSKEDSDNAVREYLRKYEWPDVYLVRYTMAQFYLYAPVDGALGAAFQLLRGNND